MDLWGAAWFQLIFMDFWHGCLKTLICNLLPLGNIGLIPGWLLVIWTLSSHFIDFRRFHEFVTVSMAYHRFLAWVFENGNRQPAAPIETCARFHGWLRYPCWRPGIWDVKLSRWFVLRHLGLCTQADDKQNIGSQAIRVSRLRHLGLGIKVDDETNLGSYAI